MADTFSRMQRSGIMRCVRTSGTSAEQSCEKLLRSLRIPYIKQFRGLPGRPDFLLRECNVALFVHGCFWHLHKGCKNAEMPRTNIDYWERKLGGNRRRDRRVRGELRAMGWRTAVIWECKLSNTASVARRLLKLAIR